MKKVMKFLFVLQETKRVPKLGIREVTQRRFNPYNPLSYIVILLTLVVGIVCYGFVGFFKEIGLMNPFKYQ